MEQVSLAPEQQMNEHLGRLAQGMQVLLDSEKEHQAALVLLADVRDSVTDVRDSVTDTMAALNTQMGEVLHGLQMLQAPAVPVSAPTMPPWMAGSAGLLGGLLLMLAVWTLWPVSPLQGFAVDLDAAITQQYAQLPKVAQESLAAVYKQYRYQAPGRGGK